MNFKKYRTPGQTERLKSSLELHFANSLLFGALNKLLGPRSGKLAVFKHQTNVKFPANFGGWVA